MNTSLAVIVALTLVASLLSPDAFAVDSPEYAFSPEGALTVSGHGRIWAEGRWENRDLGKVVSRKTINHSAKGAEWVDLHEQGQVTYTSSAEGEDLLIRAALENRSPDTEIPLLTFGGLKVHFEGKVHGLMPTKELYPGFHYRIGGSYATDGQFGLGLSPWKTGLTRHAFHWQENTFLYRAEKPVPPGSSRTVYLRLRFSATTDWQHLLQPYKEHFLATHGGLQYHPDHRLVTGTCLADPSLRNEESPLGFYAERRIDTPEGVQIYAKKQAAALKEVNGKGMILWAHTGADPRGCMFRTDHDIVPPAVSANLPVLVKEFQSQGLRIGLCARPGLFTYRVHWTGDNYLPRNVDDPEQVDLIWQRFKNTIAQGFTLYYLDVFGNELEDIKLMRELRRRMGPEILTYCEHPVDAILPYSGAYMELYARRAVIWDKSLYLYWVQPDFWTICQWLLPDFGSAIRTKINPNEIPDGKESVYAWMQRHRMTLLLQDYDHWALTGQPRGRPVDLLAIQNHYLTPDGRWRAPVEELLSRNAWQVDPARHQASMTPAMTAAAGGDLRALKEAVEEAGDINASDDLGWTAVMHAAFHNQKEAVDYLLALDPKVDLKKKSADGLTAEELARRNGNTALATVLNKGHEGLVERSLEELEQGLLEE